MIFYKKGYRHFYNEQNLEISITSKFIKNTNYVITYENNAKKYMD